ncbi:MAG: M36 family metallopeptidase [Acidobacteriota bacterium]|nr:M36 family metallopeptidase [Acidobacteriota bacterium]
MNKESTKKHRRQLFLSISALALISMLSALPLMPLVVSSAASDPETQAEKTANSVEGLENYDIRTDKSAAPKVAVFRRAAGQNELAATESRQKTIAAEAALKRRVPALKIERSADLRVPEVIAADSREESASLASAFSGSRADALRKFLKQNDDLFGLADGQVDDLKTVADYTNPDGNLSFVHLEQFIGGIPVFRGEVKAGFDKNGKMFRVINNLAPGINDYNLSENFGSPETVVNKAFKHVEREMKDDDFQRNAALPSEKKVVFGAGDWATTAEKMYFPIETGVARAAWRVLIWEDAAAYYIIVDAETGTLLWRKNIAESQTQPATYNVYANETSMMRALDSPAPMSPGIINPGLGTQAPVLPRTNVTLIGNEAPYAFNQKGWITDGNNTTDGNNVEAGLDRVSPNGVDAAVTGSNRVFNFAFNPGAPDGTGESPLATEYQKGAVTQLFYLTNRYHDEMYLLGFTEAAGNFQHENFTGQGRGGDRVSAEAQDSGGTNNANFFTPADGTRGRMQMYIWTRTTPNRDGDLDADIVIHELTHGLSNRLHGNSLGLTTNMSRSMGEGWGDFYAHCLLSEPTDPLNGVYPSGGYTLYRPTLPHNYYYGVRRLPKAILSATGGANNRPFNPMTFADIDSTQANINDGAYPGQTNAVAFDQVHAAGEIWSSALWEVRGKLIQRLGHAAGNRRILQLVTDGMKLSPLNPTFLQARDAIVAAAQASGSGADVIDVWAGFAARGMGFSAQVLNAGTGANTTRVAEAFDLPNVVQTPNFTFSDAAGNNNGYAEPGEQLVFNIPLSNNAGETITNVNLQITGGGNAAYGDIANAQTVARQISFTVPANAQCGSLLTLTFNISSSRGNRAETRMIRIGAPAFAATGQNFDSASVPALPAGWEKQQSGAYTTGWVTTGDGANSQPNSLFAPDPASGGLADVSTQARVESAASQLRFKLNYNTEPGYDGTVFEIKIGAGEWQDILAAGGSFVSGGYNQKFAFDSAHELTDRLAWTGISNGFVDVVLNLPASANNQTIGLRWRTIADGAVGGTGTGIDDLQITDGKLQDGYICGTTAVPRNSRADYDGDGKTDRAVFRDGAWYELRSQTGAAGRQFGQAGDQPLAGDFDGDDKTDAAVMRTVNGALHFYVLNSRNNTFDATVWGTQGDISAIGDYNGDNRDDIGVFRPSNGTWYVQPAGGGAIIASQFGTNGDKPVAEDYDGDGKTDFAVFRPSNATWYVQQSTAGFTAMPWGFIDDRLVPADYDNDNKADFAVFRAGNWYIRRSTNGQLQAVNFGLPTDTPVPGDYDGDGADDAAVYRGGNWYVQGSTSGFNAVQFGVASDVPIPMVFTK